MRAYDAAFYVAAFFIFGIAGASLEINIYLTLFIASLALILLKVRNMIKSPVWLGILFLSVFAGCFYCNFYAVSHKENIAFDRELIFTGVVANEPRRGIASQEFNLNLGEGYEGVVHIYAALSPSYNYGDLLEVKGEVNESPSGLNIMSFPEINITGSGKGSSIKSFLFSIKRALTLSLERVLPAEKSAFIAGVLFGERAEFSKNFTEALRKSGTTHLVALSGYNVSIIAITLSNILSYIGNKRRAFWLSIAFIFLFVLMTGAEESVVRAAIMGVIFLVSEKSSRLFSFRNAITLTAFVMLLINPRLLVFNAGFQLSFAALVGLVYLKPFIEKFIGKHNKETFLNWRENLLQTFSAQAAALPIIFATFGYFSPFSLFSNVLILEFIPLTMFLGFVTAVLGTVSYYLSFLTSWALGIVLGYEIFIINFFSAYLS